MSDATNNACVLPAELTIYTVGELAPQCRSWLDSESLLGAGDASPCLRVDAAAVCEVDAAGLQLLQSLANALAQRQARLQLLTPGTALATACAALGMTALLDGAIAAEAA